MKIIKILVVMVFSFNLLMMAGCASTQSGNVADNQAVEKKQRVGNACPKRTGSRMVRKTC